MTFIPDKLMKKPPSYIRFQDFKGNLKDLISIPNAAYKLGIGLRPFQYYRACLKILSVRKGNLFYITKDDLYKTEYFITMGANTSFYGIEKFNIDYKKHLEEKEKKLVAIEDEYAKVVEDKKREAVNKVQYSLGFLDGPNANTAEHTKKIAIHLSKDIERNYDGFIKEFAEFINNNFDMSIKPKDELSTKLYLYLKEVLKIYEDSGNYEHNM